MTSHYITTNHNLEDLKWTVIEQLVDTIRNPEKALHEKEQRWVYRLHTNQSGLNDDIAWGHFYK